MLAVPARQVARRLVDQCAPHAERLGCRNELGYIEEIIEQGSGADIQKREFGRDGDMQSATQGILDATGRPWELGPAG